MPVVLQDQGRARSSLLSSHQALFQVPSQDLLQPETGRQEAFQPLPDGSSVGQP